MSDTPTPGAPAEGASELVPLRPEQLSHPCDCQSLGFDVTTTLQPQDSPLGQERVLEAIDFGSDIDRSGYNLFVMGSPGVGKHHLLTHTLTSRAASGAPPVDWCYLADFGNPDRPIALQLPAGRGRELRHDMQQLVEDLLSALPAAFQSDEYRRRAQEIQDEFKQREDDAAAQIGEHATKRGIALLSTPTGYSLAPLKDGKVLSPPEFEALPEDERKTLQQAMAELKEELRAALGRVPLWQREMRQRFRELDADVTQLTVSQLTRELESRYHDLPEVLDYLAAVSADVVDNVALFRPQGDGDGPAADDARFTRYRVNLLVDNGNTQGAPVVFEDNPNYQNLVGRIEHVAHMGTLMTDFTLIKPGALHRANGDSLPRRGNRH